MTDLTIEQRFALTRARYEVQRMSRQNLEKTALRLLKSRMEMKNGTQRMLQSNGIIFKIDQHQDGIPEIISEETFIDLLQMQDDMMPSSIDDVDWEDDDLEDDGLTIQ